MTTPVETDAAFLLRVLSDERPHNLNDILRRSFAERGCGLTVHSRASDLRQQGYGVVNWKDGQRGDGSWYRLETPGASEHSEAPVSPDIPADPIPGQLVMDVAA